jgi:RNA polymerase sigma-70 factor (ECF subfamily)
VLLGVTALGVHETSVLPRLEEVGVETSHRANRPGSKARILGSGIRVEAMTATVPGGRTPLAAAFTSSLPSVARPQPSEGDQTRLETELERAWTTARESWPDLDVSAERFAGHLGRLAGPGEPIAIIGELATSDLYLAVAALEGSDRALTLFEGHTFGEIQAAAAAVRASESDVEETKQVIRTLLFVAAGPGGPALAEYAGRGSLRGWVRVIATRELLRMQRRQRREIPLEEYILHDLETQPDAQIVRLKDAYRSQVADALRDALERLDIRERLLLRYQICDHLSISDIGAIYQVHRATAARWLSKARSRLLELTKEQLAILLSVEPADADSILRLVQSQIDVSLERRLRDEE